MSEILPFLGSGLIIFGAFLLAIAMTLVWKIIGLLPKGRLQHSWFFLLLLILFFVISYCLYAKYSYVNISVTADIVVPIIFFLGAIFVYIVCNLSLKTTRDIMQIYILKQENNTDPLTGIFNRRYLDNYLNKETTKAQSFTLPLSVCLIDIDHFKNINDNYGHPVGDLVLKSIAKNIKESLRDSDVLTRYGGEEFVVVLPGTQVSTSYKLAERLRKNIESLQVAIPGKSGQNELTVKVTISIGVTELSLECKDYMCLIKNADTALYRAKNNGRNQVFIC
ncbi:GGDEF domain-containing protein [Shewanella metallivivens]|uniref:diguanylate cyclase n=1 Tax=Shewanella metallivivens TaxID=2872342 RepID=A0ABT5TKF3_9GAMM|nr:GGDEF domain-containing protein [Shewanella metallivivens]MDD8058364.1 GGDEF domain-containing protein [Shewanella metallivivens]